MLVISLFIVFLSFVDSARILLYNPGFGHSHMRFMSMLGDMLMEAGHEITEIRPQFESSLEFDTKTKKENIYEFPAHIEVLRLFEEAHTKDGFLGRMWYVDMSAMSMARQAENMTKMFVKNCENLIENTDLIAKLKQKTFDIGLSEAFCTCGHGIFAALGLKTIISASSSNLMDHQAILLGVPRVPSYVPGGIGNSLEKMSLLERAGNAIGSYFGAALFLEIADKQTAMFRKNFGENFASTRETISQSALLFTNSNPFVDFPAPTIHKVVPIGGIHIKTPKKLSKEWDTILNKKKRTVLISFGSVAKSVEMPDENKKSILKMVTTMPDVQFIWKYEDDDLNDEAPENLMLSKWTPQTDLLADPRLSLFITHGGLASTTEIAFSGVPVVVIPLFADQSRNGLTLFRQGIAKIFSKFDIKNPEKLGEMVKNMLDDQSYSQKAKRLSELLKNTPFSPKELLLRNMEFVTRFGPLPQLDPHGRNLSFIEYFLLDVIFLIVLALLSIAGLIIFMFKKLTSKIFGKAKTKKD
ncbi:unnamed protein product, partial [Mesorhabditis belari]|uniref:glucuronosyltransferase n=1 Tax=Mesorhabditis belari TaxID=2138241 RepID=A0AAF3J2G7_9BILA